MDFLILSSEKFLKKDLKIIISYILFILICFFSFTFFDNVLENQDILIKNKNLLRLTLDLNSKYIFVKILISVLFFDEASLANIFLGKLRPANFYIVIFNRNILTFQNLIKLSFAELKSLKLK